MRHLTQHIILLLFVTASLFSAKAATVEELRQRFENTKNAGDRYNILVEILNQYNQTEDAESQIKCLNEIVQYCHSTNQSSREADAIYTRITFFYNHGMDDSIAYHVPQDLQVLRASKNWNRYYEVWALLASSYLYSGNPNLALRVAQEIFDDAKKRNHKLGMGISYYTMGSIYTILNVLDESVKNYQKGLDIMSNIHPYPTILADLYIYYCEVLNLKKDYVGLEKLTQRWLLFLEETKKSHVFNETAVNQFYSSYYISCAQAALGLGQLDKADKMMDKSKEYLDDINNYTGQAWLLNMANLRYKQGKYQEALNYNTQRLKQADVMGDAPAYIDIVKQRAEIFQMLGQYKEAASLFEQVYHINDSVNVQDTKQQLNELNTLFKVDELKMQQERAQFRNTLIIVGLIVLALVIFSIFRYIAAKRLKVAHEKLQTTHEELLTAYDQLEETTTAKERIESDLRIARDIQQSMIPQKFPPFPERTDIDLFASMTPAKAVGGDLYDFILLNEKLYFCLGDVSGKGVPASLFMAVARNLFRVVSQQGLPPAEIADKLNNALSEDNDSGMFVTMFIGIIDLPTGRLDFCNAGHNPPVIKMPDGSTHFIEMQANAPLGLWAGLPYEGEHIDDISGCPFFVYSDGLNEAENDKQEQYGDDLLLEMLEKHEFVTSQQTVEMMKADVVRHANGAEQSDDLTMLCVKVQGNLTIKN
ncbi:MAG: SpoIIE family protein phosphatase [Prevotella sp.]|nr:SpoIIE family protein phosphatase [Prevotella sp.]